MQVAALSMEGNHGRTAEELRKYQESEMRPVLQEQEASSPTVQSGATTKLTRSSYVNLTCSRRGTAALLQLR